MACDNGFTSLPVMPRYALASASAAGTYSEPANAPTAAPGAVNPSYYELHYANEVQIMPFGTSEWVVHHLIGGHEYRFCLFVRSPAEDLIPADGGCVVAMTVNQVANLRAIDSTNTSITLEWDALTPVAAPVSYRIVASPITR